MKFFRKKEEVHEKTYVICYCRYCVWTDLKVSNTVMIISWSLYRITASIHTILRWMKVRSILTSGCRIWSKWLYLLFRKNWAGGLSYFRLTIQWSKSTVNTLKTEDFYSITPSITVPIIWTGIVLSALWCPYLFSTMVKYDICLFRSVTECGQKKKQSLLWRLRWCRK